MASSSSPGKTAASVKSLRKVLTCPITCEQLSDPVIAPDGHTYERTAIEDWLREHATSPMTRQPMSVSDLQPNRKVKEMLDKLPSKKEHRQQSTGQAASLRTIRPEAFTALDQLGDLAKSTTFQPPQIVVVGIESHGKSTILERLVGIPIFPRDKTLCTRVPIRVRFRRGPSQCFRMWEQAVDERTGRHLVDQRELLAQANLIPGTNVLERVRTAMDDIMTRLNNQRQKQGVSLGAEIVVQLQGPMYPDLDLVDLPGLVEMAHDGEDQGMPEKTRRLCKRYIEQHGDHSMFLVALDCRSAMHTTTAVRLLSDHNVLDRTLGVLTKCDMYHVEDDISDDEEDWDSDDGGSHRRQTAEGRELSALVSAETNRNFVRAGYGWVLLSSRGLPKYSSQPKKKAEKTAGSLLNGLDACHTTEAAFFNRHGVDMSQHAGIATLCRYVTRSFESYIRQKWVPEALSRVYKAKTVETDKLLALGSPFLKKDADPSKGSVPLPTNVATRLTQPDELASKVRRRLKELLADPHHGLLATVNNWLDQRFAPLFAVLQQQNRAYVSPGSVRRVTDLGKAADLAAAVARELLSKSQLSTGGALPSSPAKRRRTIEVGPTVHEATLPVKSMLLSDASELRVGRFETAINAVVESLSPTLERWSKGCADVAEVLKRTLCSFIEQHHARADASALAALMSSAEEALAPRVTAMLRQEVQRCPWLLVGVAEALLCICKQQLRDMLGDVASLVETAAALSNKRLLIDNNSSARKELTNSLTKLNQASDRLAALLPDNKTSTGIAKEAAKRVVRRAFRRRGRAALAGTSGARSREQFVKALNEAELEEETKKRMIDVLDGNTNDLNLDNCKLKDSNIPFIATLLRHCGNVQSLSLADNLIGDTGLETLAEAISNNSTLLKLNLRKNGISPFGVAKLAHVLETNRFLQTLSLEGNNLGAAGAAVLARTLETNQRLESLNLASTQINDDGARMLARALRSNKSLQTLRLDGNIIDDGGAEAIGNSLEVNSTLKALNLSNNHIDNEGADAIFQALEANRSLTELRLNASGARDNVAEALARTLETNSCLRVLHLENNKISDVAAQGLAKALMAPTSALEHLNLGNNSIKDIGAEALARALENNEKLKVLSLKMNQIETSGAAAFRSVLRGNTRLSRLNLAGNAISGMILQQLRSIAAAKPSMELSL